MKWLSDFWNRENLEEGETFPGENRLFDKIFDTVEETADACKATAEAIIDHVVAGLSSDDQKGKQR